MYVVIFKTYPQSPTKAIEKTFKDKEAAQDQVDRMVRSGTYYAAFRWVEGFE